MNDWIAQWRMRLFMSINTVYSGDLMNSLINVVPIVSVTVVYNYYCLSIRRKLLKIVPRTSSKVGRHGYFIVYAILHRYLWWLIIWDHIVNNSMLNLPIQYAISSFHLYFTHNFSLLNTFIMTLHTCMQVVEVRNWRRKAWSLNKRRRRTEKGALIPSPLLCGTNHTGWQNMGFKCFRWTKYGFQVFQGLSELGIKDGLNEE